MLNLLAERDEMLRRLERRSLRRDGSCGNGRSGGLLAAGPVALDAIGEMTTEAVDPFPDCFPADVHAVLGLQSLDIRRPRRKAVIRPDRVGDDFTGETVALKARHIGGYRLGNRLFNPAVVNKLATPNGQLRQDSF